MKYSKIEILKFLKSNHRQRIQIEFGLPNEDEITFDLTIKNWIDDMELLNWKELCKYYCKVFEIENHEFEFRDSMLPIKNQTIGDFCQYISVKALKPELKSVKLFGRDCEEAGIFKYLKSKIAEENESNSNGMKPSSKIEYHLNDCSFKIVEEVNKINPDILPTIKYEPNEFEKHNWKLFLSGMVALIIASIICNWLIAGVGIGLIISGIWMNKIGLKMKPKKLEFEGIETFRDLVVLIKKKKNSMQSI